MLMTFSLLVDSPGRDRTTRASTLRSPLPVARPRRDTADRRHAEFHRPVVAGDGPETALDELHAF